MKYEIRLTNIEGHNFTLYRNSMEEAIKVVNEWNKKDELTFIDIAYFRNP
jgi:hypothetical protein